jgi:hypothetical protein
MGRIRIATPQGIATVDIEGDTPTQDELDRLRQLAPPEDPAVGFDYRVVADETPTETAVAEAETVEEPDGEVKDTLLRYMTGRMDTDEEKQNLLNQLLGEGASRRLSEDTFVIDQEKVAPEVREKYGLADSGTIYLDKPGFTGMDIIDFGGEAGPSVAAAIGASIAVTGVGFIHGMAIVGGAAALAKAADESIEWAQGLNRQSAGEVAASIATEGILNAVFEGAGRIVAKGIGRLIKGPGPQISAQRIDALVETGMSTRRARTVAREEALAQYRRMVAAGARPTVQAAAGKSLAARALAVNEKIMPNPRVGEENVRFVEQMLKAVDDGVITQEEALERLFTNNKALANLISQNLADPDKAFKLSKQHLDDVVKKELDRFEAIFVPSTKLPEEYSESARLVSSLFKTESQNLYDLATRTMGAETKFSRKPITDALEELALDNPFVQYTGSLFNTLKHPDYAEMTIGQLQQLKAGLRLSAGDPELVAPAAQAGIGKLITSIDELLDGKFLELSRNLARGYKIERHPAGAVDTAGKAIGGRFHTVPLAPGEKESLRQGLGQWKEANIFYGEGQEQFNNVAVNNIIKQAKDRYFTSNLEVMRTTIDVGNAPKLQMYLDAITPTSNMAQRLVQSGATETVERVRALVDGDQFVAAQDLVFESGLSSVLPKIQGFMEKLPRNDVFRVMQKQAYLEELDNALYLSRAGTDPKMIRESVRNGLAKHWIDAKRLESQELGQFSPTRFADHFSKLGPKMQDTLFGTETAATMREAMDAFRLTAMDSQNAAKFFDTIPTMVNQPLREGIQALKEISEQAVSESSDAVLKAVRSGDITSPKALVAGLLDNPSSYKRLSSVIGDTELEKVGGVKDMVMNNLIHANIGKTPFNEAHIQSGAWGKALRDNIFSQNKNGALDTILGADVVKALDNIAEEAIRISDVAIKGFGGIAAAPAAIAMIALIATGQWIKAGVTAAGVVGLARMLRNKGVLKLLTSTKMRASEYNKALAAGAKLPSLARAREAGEITYALNRIGSIIASETALVTGAGVGLLDEMVGETTKGAESQARAIQQGRRPVSEPRRGLPPLPEGPSRELMQALGALRGIPGYSPVERQEVLRRVEQEKLMGLRN